MMTVSEEVESLHKRLSPPTPSLIKSLRTKGVSLDALCEPELPAFVNVVFHDDQPLFDFTDEACDEGAVRSLVFLARDESGDPLDLVAWSRKTNRLASWYGRAALLGLESRWAPRIGAEGLRICFDPLAWLVAERDGVVIIDPESARWQLARESLVVSDVAFGRHVHATLRLPDPKVYVESGRAAA